MNIRIDLDNVAQVYGRDYELEGALVLVEDEQTKFARLDGEILFRGPAFDLLMARLVDSPEYARTGLVAGVPIDIWDICGLTPQLLFRGEARADTIKFCDRDCFFAVSPIPRGPEKRFFDGLESSYISEPETTRELIDHPKLMYANVAGGNLLNYIINFFGSLLLLTLSAIDLVVDILRTVANVLTLGTQSDKLRGFDLSPAIISLSDSISGLQFFHPTPYVTTYLNELFALVGQRTGTPFTFVSSIFASGSPYEHTVYFKPDERRGLDTDFNALDVRGLITHAPLVAGAEMLDDMAKVFNARWRFIGNTVKFERKDSFEGIGPDLRGAKTCYDISDATLKSAIDIQYTDDALDTEANINSAYDWFVLWNKDPFSNRQKGIEKPAVPFARSRQLYDSTADYSALDKAVDLDKFYVTQTGFALMGALAGGIIRAFAALLGNDPSVKLRRLRRDRPPILAMNNGTVSVAKLLVIDPARNPLWGNLIVDFNQAYWGKYIYDRFWEINNPRGEFMRGRKPMTFSVSEAPAKNTYRIYDRVQLTKGIGTITAFRREIWPGRIVELTGTMQ